MFKRQLGLVGVCLKLATSIFLTSPALAQETDSLKQRIDVLESKVDSLENVIRNLREEAAAAEEEGPEAIARFSGSGRKNTRPFRVTGPWRVSWVSSAEVFFLNGYEAGKPNSTYPAMIAGPNAPSNGISYIDRGGRYYLIIQSSGPWTVTVEKAD
jgi:outer membrane murein-binding lipoprotein Lpp